MDKKIEKKKWPVKKIIYACFVLIFCGFFIQQFFIKGNSSKLYIDKSNLSITEIKQDTFQENMTFTGTLIPKNTVFIDAIQPGTIKTIYKTSGDIVTKGEILFDLSNSSLQLNIMTQVSSLYERLNNLRDSKLQLDQNNLNQLMQYSEINNQLKLLEPQFERYKKLVVKKLVSQKDYEQVKSSYDQIIERKKLFVKTYQNDSISRLNRLKQINQSEGDILKNIAAVQNILSELSIQSPVSGRLNYSDINIGQSITSGQRLAQIYVVDEYLIKASIEESYLTRINKGFKGNFEYSGKIYNVIISKIYPQINSNGLFDLEMQIPEAPKNIVSGQNFRISIELGGKSASLLLPIGGFTNKTGGNWIYKLSKDGKSAHKQNIKLGRKNSEYYEIIEGLNDGDKVIISSYDNIGNMDKIIIN